MKSGDNRFLHASRYIYGISLENNFNEFNNNCSLYSCTIIFVSSAR